MAAKKGTKKAKKVETEDITEVSVKAPPKLAAVSSHAQRNSKRLHRGRGK